MAQRADSSSWDGVRIRAPTHSNDFLSLGMGPWIIHLTSDIPSNLWNENNCGISHILHRNYKAMMVSKNKVMGEYSRQIQKECI